MNIRLIKRAIFAILIVINCVVIFNFSAQDSDKSSEQSGVVVDRVVNTIEKKSKKAKKDPSLREKVTFYVRKTAHFSIYTLLGLWLMNEANTFDINKKKKWIICLLFGFLYAVSDEFHQSFVGGRSQEIRDILIDTIGVAFGCLIAVIVCLIVSILFNRKDKKIEKGENA